MKKSSFTLVELVFVVAILTLFAIMFFGCGKKKADSAADPKADGLATAARLRAQRSNCINNLKQMGTIGMQYLNDNRSSWYNNPVRSYACSLAKGKYVPDDMKKNEYMFCPAVERDPGQQGKITTFDQSNIQMYASVGEIRTGRYNDGAIFFNYSSLYEGADRIGGEKTNKNVSPSNRIWFCDGLRPDTQRQKTLLVTESSYTGENDDCARPYAIHIGRVHFATVAGNVASSDLKSLKDYYLPYFGPRQSQDGWGEYGYSVRVGTYISADDPGRVRDLAE